MKRLIGLAILTACMAVPSYSQTSHALVAATSSGAINNSSGGWGGGGGGGGSFGNKLPSVPPAHFNMMSASGSEQTYVPSTFLSFDKALVAGQGVLDAPAPSVAEAARQQVSVHTEKAKIALVQDDYGRAIILRR